MLTVEQLRQIRTLLASDRLRVPGNEVIAVAQLLVAVEREEVQVAANARLIPKPPQAPQE